MSLSPLPSPGSADCCIGLPGSDVLDHCAVGCLLLPGATSFPAEVSEPGKGWPLRFEKEAAGGVCVFRAVPPNCLPQTLAEAQQPLALDFPILL